MPNKEDKPDLAKLLKEFCADNKEIVILSLATTDGFNIKSLAAKSLSVEPDKLAAMSSSLFALSTSSSMQLMKSESNVTTIESETGNVLLISASYLTKPCVLTMVVKAEMSLAQARFSVKRLSEKIGEMRV